MENMKEIKIAVIGYKEFNYQGETQDEQFGPAMKTFIFQSENTIESYYMTAIKIAQEDGFSILSAVIANNVPLFKQLNLDEQFNEQTKRFNMNECLAKYGE